MVLKELKVKVDVSPTELAESFLRMENSEKAQFFNAIGFLLTFEQFDLYHLDLIGIGQEPKLNEDGKRVLKLFKLDKEVCMSNIKIGDLVVFNDKYWVADKLKNNVYKVKSEPWEASGTMIILLEGFGGGYALDGLTKVEMMCGNEESAISIIQKVREDVCERICKYPSMYTGEEWEMNHEEICKNCPLDRL